MVVALLGIDEMWGTFSKTLIQPFPAQAIERTGVNISYGRLLDVSCPLLILPDNVLNTLETMTLVWFAKCNPYTV